MAEKRVVDQVQCLPGLLSLDNARNTNLARALTYHLNINIAFCEAGEHVSRDTYGVAHLLADERKDGHVATNNDLNIRQYE